MGEPTPFGGGGTGTTGGRTGCGALQVLAGAMLWGTTGTAQALAPAGATPPAVGAARLLVGGLALLALGAGRGLPGPLRRWPWTPLLLSAACMAAYQPLFFGGVARAGVAVGTLVGIGSSPIATGLLAAVLRGERLTGRWLAATLLAVAGASLLAGSGGELRAEPLGVAMAMGAGVAYALYTVTSKRLLEEHDPAAVAAVVFAVAGLGSAPLLLLSDPAWLLRPRGALVALHLGLVATALAYTLFTRGLRRLPAATAATLSLAEPLTATFLGTVVLREPFTGPEAAGALLLLGGLLLLALPPGISSATARRLGLRPPAAGR
ncbi:MAG: EamA family transporter [Bacillota bacterium]|nr:EamA family transporter [Bacillota bacterium]